MGNFGLQLLLIVDALDLSKLLVQRLKPVGFNLRLVHTSRIVVAYLLFAAAFWRIGVLSRCFENLMQDVFVSFVQQIRYSPTRVRSRNWVGSEPAAVCILIEIGAGGRFLIHVCLVEPMTSLTQYCGDSERNKQKDSDETLTRIVHSLLRY